MIWAAVLLPRRAPAAIMPACSAPICLARKALRAMAFISSSGELPSLVPLQAFEGPVEQQHQLYDRREQLYEQVQRHGY
jgi:hypothetical protein